MTMAAGLTIARIQELAGGDYPVIRIMPNTPVFVGQGMVLYACSGNVKPEALEAFLEAFAWAGRFSAIPESGMDAGSAVSGCGPAFADLFLEALADGGVNCGLPREQALELAAQMLLGSASLALETGLHPGVLKDTVCSPGGTTIQGVRKLEEAGFRGGCHECGDCRLREDAGAEISGYHIFQPVFREWVFFGIILFGYQFPCGNKRSRFG